MIQRVIVMSGSEAGIICCIRCGAETFTVGAPENALCLACLAELSRTPSIDDKFVTEGLALRCPLCLKLA